MKQGGRLQQTEAHSTCTTRGNVWNMFSVFHQALYLLHMAYPHVQSTLVLALKNGEETVICVLLIIVQLHGSPVITRV